MRSLRAVLLDVDFTLAKPRACLEAAGYCDVARRYGLTPVEARYAEARAQAALAHRYHPELEHDEDVWLTLTENIVRGMGGSTDRATEVARELVRMWEDCENFELYDDTREALDTLRSAGLKVGLVSNGGRDLGRFVEHFDLRVHAHLHLPRCTRKVPARASSWRCSDSSTRRPTRRRWSVTHGWTTWTGPVG